MHRPTIHLNGTAKGDLHTGYMNALLAAEEAIKALNKCWPHGRDYYPQGEDAIMRAREEHSRWVRSLEAMRKELEELCFVTAP